MFFHLIAFSPFHLFLPLCLFAFLPFSLSAQTFTQRIQQHIEGMGRVTIHQTDSISRLVNSGSLGSAANPAVTPVVPPTTTPATNNQSSSSTTNPSANSTTNVGKTTSNIASTTADADASGDATSVEPTRKMMRNSYKVNGYRVQAFAGGNSRQDRQQAEKTGNDIKASFPDVPVYVHFYSPRWICRVGNFRTYEEAHQMLTSLRRLGFTQATIVKGKISVPY